MTKRDFELIAEAVAEVERMTEELPDPNGVGASTLRLVVDSLAGRLAERNPRFKRGLFETACLPVQHARRAEVIRRVVGR